MVSGGEDFCLHAYPGAMKCDFGRHFLLPAPAHTAPPWQGSEQEQYQGAASVTDGNCSILGWGTHI